MANRTGKGWFKPGQSGNPGGAKKQPEEFRDLARTASVPALKRAIELMASEDSAVALKACDIVMNRAWGRPEQSLDVTHHKSPLDDLDAGTLRSLVRALAGAEDQPEAGGGTAPLN